MSSPKEGAKFTVDAEIYSRRGKSANPDGECLCGCGPLGHVFGFGVQVPSVTRPGLRGDRVPGSVDDWIMDTLYRAYRGDGGRKIRVTVEILPACLCAIDGTGEVIPPACPVHGIPCDECGGVESCKEDCGG